MIVGLEILDWNVPVVEVFDDLRVVINHLSGEYKSSSLDLVSCYALAKKILDQFEDVELCHVLRSENEYDNGMA